MAIHSDPNHAGHLWSVLSGSSLAAWFGPVMAGVGLVEKEDEMGFPPHIAEQALLDCQRFCCLCHKFCGTRIELHHIRQVRDGGDDSMQNCIPLCFDCHADVKAYNVDHPKGRKYTESELHQHRDRWFAFCSTNAPITKTANASDEILVNITLRPDRLRIRNLLLAFADYCVKYPNDTLDAVKSPGRTRLLVSEIRRIKEDVEIVGPLSIREFGQLYATIISNAWNLQRLIDRQSGVGRRPIDSRFESIEENIDHIVDWFSEAGNTIKQIIDPYLALL